MTGLDTDVNYGNCPEIVRSFTLELKSYDDDRKKFFILKMETCYGEVQFILLPEEVKSLADACNKLLKGIELRVDFIPKTVNVPVRKEMFPDI